MNTLSRQYYHNICVSLQIRTEPEAIKIVLFGMGGSYKVQKIHINNALQRLQSF